MSEELKRLIARGERAPQKPSLDEFIGLTGGMSYHARILKWFQINLNRKVTSNELAKIPGKKGDPISHNIRRVFELRDEKGYNIVNWKDNKATGLGLKVDEWVLLERDPSPSRARSRGVNKRIAFEVFQRDGHRCRICGRGKDDDDPFRPGHKLTLHVGHIIAHKRDGERELVRIEGIEDVGADRTLTKDDFITMCNVCNEGAKNSDMKILDFSDMALQLPEDEQRAIYERLRKKFS